jgi:predicted Rossmann-fold nucleotide-binding protein
LCCYFRVLVITRVPKALGSFRRGNGVVIPSGGLGGEENLLKLLNWGKRRTERQEIIVIVPPEPKTSVCSPQRSHELLELVTPKAVLLCIFVSPTRVIVMSLVALENFYGGGAGRNRRVRS